MISARTIQKLMNLETGWISDADDTLILCLEKTEHQVQISVYERQSLDFNAPMTWKKMITFAYKTSTWEATAGELLQRFFSSLER